MAARTVAEVIAGEAVSGSPEQRMADMRAIASVIANRAQQLGVTPQEVVARQSEFNAYGNRLPPGVNQAIIDMAQQAIDDVEVNGPYNNATFYATPSAVDNLPGRLSFEDETTGHQFFSDPHGRAIYTSLGLRTPNQFAYAANPTNVPTPFSAEQGLLAPETSAWGLNPDVAPALTPTVESWSGLASAAPVEAPTQGLLSANATVSSRMGIAEPSFDQSRFDGLAPSTATGFDMSRFADPAPSLTDTARMNPLTGAINPATNTQSFMDDPAATGLLSANHQQVQQMAEQALANAMKDQQQITPSAITAYSPTVTEQAPAVNAIANQMATPSLSPSQIAGYQQMAEVAPAGGIMNLAGQSIISPTGLLSAPAVAPVEQAPALETVEVADQPTVAGPATTPAVEQQTQQQAVTPSSVTAPASVQAQQTAPSLSFGQRMAKAINPGTITGGLLGGLALGPVGGIVGGLLGNSVYSGGGLLGGGFVSPTNQIGGGMANIASIYGGNQAPGTFAVANNGATITAQPGGYTSYTNRFGVTESIGPDGKIAADWSGMFSGDDSEDSESGSTSGGLFGGLFG